MIVNIIDKIQFGNFAWILLVPVCMMTIDVITGLMDAWAMKNFMSAKMRAGLAKKGGELMIILVGLLFTYGMGIPLYILKGISIYIILMELMSIVENLDKLGAPLPKALKDVINNLGDTVQNDDIATMNKRIKELEELLKESK